MKQKLIVEFTKMNAAGNDFIVIDNRFFHFTDAELGDIARRMCPRRTGIGADGVLALASSKRADVHFRMRYVNADGSVGTMCGNGARCLARFAKYGGITGDRLVFETDAGLHTAVVPETVDSDVTISMREPSRFEEMDGVEGLNGSACFIWTGTEHIVSFVADLEQIDVTSRGAAARRSDTLKPNGANINFVAVHSDGVLAARTYEKGVEAETQACGTGAVAAAVAAFLSGRTDRHEVEVRMQGGVLTVTFEPHEASVRNVTLRGPADAVFRGTFEWG